MPVERSLSRRRTAAPRLGDTDVHVVVPSGRPRRIGRGAAHLTGSRPPAHGERRRVPRLDRHGWVLAGSTLVVLVAAVVILTVPHARSTVLPLADPGPIGAPDSGASTVEGVLPPPVDLSQPAPPTAPPSSAPAPALAVATGPARYTAVAGEGCGQSADHGFVRKGVDDSWYLRSHGGPTTDGCNGAAWAVPMSGDAKKDDRKIVVEWYFTTGAVTSGSCLVSVYVPNTGVADDSAGRPAHYAVYGSVDATGTPLGQFTIDQTQTRGRYVDAGRYPASGHLSVRLTNRGVDFGEGRDDAHLGAAAVRVTCSAA